MIVTSIEHYILLLTSVLITFLLILLTLRKRRRIYGTGPGEGKSRQISEREY